ARSLNAAMATTIAGSTMKTRMAPSTTTPATLNSLSARRRMSVLSDPFERARGGAQQRDDAEREDEPGDGEGRREGKIEAGKAELIDEVRYHVDAASADELRGGEGAEGPGERRGDAGDDAGHGQRQGNREEGADRPSAEARGGTGKITVDVGERR